ncbi:MAG TPA: VOC family protein [Frankiaceae bacterium]|nr:VOC family protein [Frankiaceae bacterium]
MILNVSIVNVFVLDQDAAKQFYTEILGFTERDDVTLGEGFRRCTGQPPPPAGSARQPRRSRTADDCRTRRSADAGPKLRRPQRLGFKVDDCHQTHKELTAKGVEFVQPPTTRPYGVEAVCRDNSGNWMVLVEER